MKYLILFVFIALISLSGAINFTHATENYPDGTLLRGLNDNRVYAITNNHKRHIPNMAIFNSYGFKMDAVREVDQQILDTIPNVQVVKTYSSPVVFDITSGVRLAFQSAEQFEAAGYAFDNVVVINQLEMDSYPLFQTNGELPDQQKTLPTETGDSSDTQTHSFLFQKIEDARELLAKAQPIYPQTKVVTNVRTLSSGVTGSDVKLVQEKLQELGYFPAATETNGTFGPTTLRAVKAFQAAQGISQTGTVGPQTKAALERKGLKFPSAGSVLSEWTDEVPVDREVLLALWNKNTGAVEPVHITLKFSGKTYTVINQTTGFNVKYKSGNGVNVQYEVKSPSGYMVIANRFPIFDDAPGEIGSFPPIEEVYVPYNDQFRTPEIIAAGKRYLDEVVEIALNDLRQKGVRSVSGTGLVADNIVPDELKNIAIIEHIDYGEFRRAEDKQAVLNKVFTILGTNREEAYRFAGSSKGALGLAQFIEKTYIGIRNRYPSANLNSSFKNGMSDHINAIKAMALYYDTTDSALQNFVRDNITSDPAEFSIVMAEVRAAAYNGGASRVKTAIKKFGIDWQVASSSSYGLRAETKSYLDKFRTVRQVLAML